MPLGLLVFVKKVLIYYILCDIVRLPKFESHVCQATSQERAILQVIRAVLGV